MTTSTGGFRCTDGTCIALFAYDVGYGIDLARAAALPATGTVRAGLRHERPSAAYLQFRSPPVRIECERTVLDLAGTRSEARVEVTLYEFGAISVAYRIAIDGRSADELVPIAVGLYENRALLDDSRARVGALLETLAAAVTRPNVAELVEDYVIYHVRRWQPESPPKELIEGDRATFGRVLDAESEPLRRDEVDDALSHRIGYGTGDEVVIGWNAAFVFDARGEDTLAVLEYANVELLELRHLDDRLDAALDRSYETLRRAGGRGSWSRALRTPSRELHHVAFLQMDAALLFEGVNNAIKLVGDQYLARLYRLAAARFHLPDWDASVLRKLETVESIYHKLADAASTWRMELLEWVIIVLIAVSIAIPFVAGAGK